MKRSTETSGNSSSNSRGVKERTSDCPRYEVNLDDPPQQRWQHIIQDYKEHFPTVIDFVDDMIGTGVSSSIITTVLANFNDKGKIFYSEELEGIASVSGLPIGKIALLQVAYEVFAACTSVVVDMPSSNISGLDDIKQESAPFHIRTMDWSLDVLVPMTIEVDFTRGGHVVTTATTWAGYVGILTGMKPGVASVSVNYRRTVNAQSWYGQVRMTMGVVLNAWRGLWYAWPVAFLVREALIYGNSYASIVKSLEVSSLMAPTYITVAGVKAGEGQVITRNRTGSERPWKLQTDGPIVQTNMDYFNMYPRKYLGDVNASDESYDWQDICWSRYRERAARVAIREMHENDTLYPEKFWALFSISPCLAEDTVYTVAMCPRSGMYVTRAKVTLADKRLGRSEWKEVFDMKMASATEDESSSGATRF